VLLHVAIEINPRTLSNTEGANSPSANNVIDLESIVVVDHRVVEVVVVVVVVIVVERRVIVVAEGTVVVVVVSSGIDHTSRGS